MSPIASDAVVPVASRVVSLEVSGPPACTRTLADGCPSVDLVSAEGSSTPTAVGRSVLPNA